MTYLSAPASVRDFSKTCSGGAGACRPQGASERRTCATNLKDVRHGTRYDAALREGVARTAHCEGLARPRLRVCRRVVSEEGRPHNSFHRAAAPGRTPARHPRYRGALRLQYRGRTRHTSPPGWLSRELEERDEVAPGVHVTKRRHPATHALPFSVKVYVSAMLFTTVSFRCGLRTRIVFSAALMVKSSDGAPGTGRSRTTTCTAASLAGGEASFGAASFDILQSQ